MLSINWFKKVIDLENEARYLIWLGLFIAFTNTV